jgi:DNA-binding IclR family transcriptional regulator
MTEHAKSVLTFLQSLDQAGKTFTLSEISKIGEMNSTLAKSVVNELERNGYIEIAQTYISGNNAYRLV